MRALSVIYEVTSEKAESAIVARIKEYRRWFRLADGCYAIYTDALPIKVFDQLRPHISCNDQVYVIPLKKPYTGYGPRKTIKWLNEKLDYC